MQKILPDFKIAVVQIVYTYWAKKRKKNNGKPLLTELMGPPNEVEDSPYHPFHKRMEKPRGRGRRNDFAAFQKMKQLRLEMENARTLLEMIKRRERMKKELFEAQIELFDAQCVEIKKISEKPAPKRKTKKRPASKSPKKSKPKPKKAKVTAKTKSPPPRKKRKR